MTCRPRKMVEVPLGCCWQPRSAARFSPRSPKLPHIRKSLETQDDACETRQFTAMPSCHLISKEGFVGVARAFTTVWSDGHTKPETQMNWFGSHEMCACKPAVTVVKGCPNLSYPCGRHIAGRTLALYGSHREPYLNARVARVR